MKSRLAFGIILEGLSGDRCHVESDVKTLGHSPLPETREINISTSRDNLIRLDKYISSLQDGCLFHILSS